MGRKYKSSKSVKNQKVKYTVRKDNIIMEDTHIFKIKGESFKSTVKFISDPKEPFYKHVTEEVK